MLRVERELLQIEQEELKRQRANLLMRENFARKELEHGSKMLMSANRLSLQDVNQNVSHHHVSSSTSSSTASSTLNVPSPLPYSMPPPQNSSMPMDYRQSMPNLLDAAFVPPPISGPPLTPPAKPSRQLAYMANGGYAPDYQNVEDFVRLRDPHHATNTTSNQPGNMSRHTLHALSAVPKPKLTDVWVQQQASTVARISEQQQPLTPNDPHFAIQRKGAPINERTGTGGDQWMGARKSGAVKGLGYGKHWLVQEAEQRRLDQQRGVRPTPNPQNWPIKGAGHLHRKSMPDISSEKKPLSDAVINTITQRLQSRMSVGHVVDKRR